MNDTRSTVFVADNDDLVTGGYPRHAELGRMV
jgi:hypothetical protein